MGNEHEEDEKPDNLGCQWQVEGREWQDHLVLNGDWVLQGTVAVLGDITIGSWPCPCEGHENARNVRNVLVIQYMLSYHHHPYLKSGPQDKSQGQKS